MKNKSDVPFLLQEFCAMVSTQFQTKAKVFKSNNGGEYVNHTLAYFFFVIRVLFFRRLLHLHLNKMVCLNGRIVK